MIILPAIDIIEGSAVRLYKGDYEKKTVYSGDPVRIALDFKEKGAQWIHIVDLDGAKSGKTPNFDVIADIVKTSGLCAEVGGGVRSIETIEKYLAAGVKRVILGTAAAKDPGFTARAVEEFGEKIAVGIDIKDGFVAVDGWTKTTALTAEQFLLENEQKGVRTVICTDISLDGAMRGTNRELYKSIVGKTGINIIASGGVSSLDDVKALKGIGVYGAIIGKAYYTGAIDIKEATEVSK